MCIHSGDPNKLFRTQHPRMEVAMQTRERLRRGAASMCKVWHIHGFYYLTHCKGALLVLHWSNPHRPLERNERMIGGWVQGVKKKK